MEMSWDSGVPAVQSDITLGNGSSSISLNSGTNYIFRAVSSFTINDAFTATSEAA